MSLSTSGRVTVTSPRTTPAAHSSDRSRKSAGSSSTSAMPISAACFGLSILFCISGFCRITWVAAGMPIRFGSSWVPPQPGTSPRKHSGRLTAAAPREMVR